MSTTRSAALSAACVLFGASLTFSATLEAQPKSTPPPGLGPFVRTVDVTVSNLDVIVTDSKGNRVKGLTKDDFVVVEDGLNQLITNFYAVDGGKLVFLGDEPVPTPVPAAAPEPTPKAAPLPVPKTWIVVFVDNLHLSPFNRNRVLRNLEDWIRGAVKGDVEGMIVTFNRSLKVRRKFTTDARDLSDVLKQIEEESALGQSTVSERRDLMQAIDDAQSEDQAVGKVRQYAQAQVNDLQFTFDAMKTTINQLSGLDGRKIMLHVSDGLPQSPGAEMWQYIQDRFHSTGTTSATNSFEFDKTSSYVGIVQAANAAGVSLYMFDASGLSVDTNVTAESRTTQARINTFIESGNLQSMLRLLADETGGKAVVNKNDITPALKEVEADYTSYYSLGYRSLRSGSDRPHAVEVKVKRKGLTVRARRSYVEKSPETKIREAVTTALYFPREQNPLGVGIEVGTPSPADKYNFVVPIRLRIPYSRITMLPEGAKVRGRLNFYFIVVDSLGKESDLAVQNAAIDMTAKAFENAQRGDYVYDVRMVMVPGGQKLSIAVRDEITNTVSYLQKPIFVSVLPPSTPAKP